MDKKLESILKRVQKPSRYVGGEFGIANLSAEARVRFCLCYPGLYEEGMANSDVRIIYSLFNDRKGYNCERCFAPFIDMGSELKNEQYLLYSLETKTPLNKFNCLGFVLNDSLSFINFAYMLDLANIPFMASERTNAMPFVFGLGKAMYNPEPIGCCLDFALIGDYEDLSVKVIDTIMKCRLSNLSRKETLLRLSMLDGVYVPSLVENKFSSSNKLEKISGKIVKRQIVRDLDRAYFPNKLMIANESGKEFGFIEPVRGCTKCCRFCPTCYLNRPARERRVQNLVSQATSQIVSSGLNSLQIASVEPGEYGALDKLINFIDPLCEENNATWQIENHQLEAFQNDYTSMKRTRQILVNIEAATQRLRNIINKNLTDSELDDMLLNAFKEEVTAINLCFQIGLPFERSEDLMGIVLLINRIKDLFVKSNVSSKPLNITVTTRAFIPRPFTPFQWCAFLGKKEIEKRQEFLSAAFSKMGVRYIHDDAGRAEVEAILSRGDRKLCKAILVAYKSGAVLPETDLFSYNHFEQAFSVCGINVGSYLYKKDVKDVLAWDLIDPLITKDYFLKEYNKAAQGDITVSCKNNCSSCGVAGSGGCKYGPN